MQSEPFVSEKDAKTTIFLSHEGTDFIYIESINNMITLRQVSQYAKDNNLGDDTDIFAILSQMQLVYDTPNPSRVKTSTPTESHVEWTTDEVLELFSS